MILPPALETYKGVSLGLASGWKKKVSPDYGLIFTVVGGLNLYFLPAQKCPN